VSPPFKQDELVDRFRAFDAAQSNGKGKSENPDSGALGWGEQNYLNGYVSLYRVTEDTAWLDKIVDHTSRMIANMRDYDGDGIPEWHTDHFSVALVRAFPLHNRGTAGISPAEQRIGDNTQARQVHDAAYTLTFTGKTRYVICDPGTHNVLHEGTYIPGQSIDALTGFSIVIEGAPLPGDAFRIEAQGVRPIQYAVHEGMVLYPVARFIEIVLSDSALEERYGYAARTYLSIIEERILRKQERFWLDLSDDAGAYRFTDSNSERFPNRVLPHNQYLALARVYLVLKDVTDHPLYLDRATRMANYFKQHLEETGDAYTWNYWDWIEAGTAGHSMAEDSSHGHIDVGFAVEACRRKVGFTDEDLMRFAHTLLDQMWNGSLQHPRIGARVDTKEGDAYVCTDWVDLCVWEPRVWDLCWALFCKQGEPPINIPSILQGWQRLVQAK